MSKKRKFVKKVGKEENKKKIKDFFLKAHFLKTVEITQNLGVETSPDATASNLVVKIKND